MTTMYAICQNASEVKRDRKIAELSDATLILADRNNPLNKVFSFNYETEEVQEVARLVLSRRRHLTYEVEILAGK